MQDVKQHYPGLAPAVARFPPSPQKRYARPAPHLQSDLLSGPEDLAPLSSHPMLSAPVADTPHPDTLYSIMPSLVAQSNDDSDSDSDSGSDADTDPGDDQSDAEVIHDDPSPCSLTPMHTFTRTCTSLAPVPVPAHFDHYFTSPPYYYESRSVALLKI